MQGHGKLLIEWTSQYCYGISWAEKQ